MCGVAVLRNALHTRLQRTQVRKEHIRMLPKELVSQKEPFFGEGFESVVAAVETRCLAVCAAPCSAASAAATSRSTRSWSQSEWNGVEGPRTRVWRCLLLRRKTMPFIDVAHREGLVDT